MTEAEALQCNGHGSSDTQRRKAGGTCPGPLFLPLPLACFARLAELSPTRTTTIARPRRTGLWS